MPSRSEGNSFHLTLYNLVTRWMPSTILFSVSGRFILIPDIDLLDTALALGAAAAATAASTSTSRMLPSPSQNLPAKSSSESDTDTPDGSESILPKSDPGECTLSMSSYSSMRRQLCAYNFYAIEPQTTPLSEMPAGVVFSDKSRVWFHAHFYRGATSWRKVPRTVSTKRRQAAKMLKSAASSLSSSPSPILNTAYQEAFNGRQIIVRKTALKYRDALAIIQRETVLVTKVTSPSSLPLSSPPATSPLTKADCSPSSPPSLVSLPSPAMSAAVSIPMHSLRPLPMTPTHVNKVNKMSLSFILNSPPR